MKDITEFKAWFNNEIGQYPLIAKSNPLSLNELCYVLRQSGRDFSVGWPTDTGYGTVPSIQNCFIPSRDLKRKVMLTDFYPVEPDDCCDDTFLGDIRVDVIPEQLEVNVRGHLRRYKSGKVVWVKPSVKYKGKTAHHKEYEL